MSYHTFILHAGRHLGMLKWLVNCFLKAIVKFLDWQRMQEWKLACSCPWSQKPFVEEVLANFWANRCWNSPSTAFQRHLWEILIVES